MEVTMGNGFGAVGFAELNENELMWVDGGVNWWGVGAAVLGAALVLVTLPAAITAVGAAASAIAGAGAAISAGTSAATVAATIGTAVGTAAVKVGAVAAAEVIYVRGLMAI